MVLIQIEVPLRWRCWSCRLGNATCPCRPKACTVRAQLVNEHGPDGHRDALAIVQEIEHLSNASGESGVDRIFDKNCRTFGS